MGYNGGMKTRSVAALALVLATSCRSSPNENKGSIDTATVPTPEDSEEGADTAPPVDTAPPEDTAPPDEPEEDPGPIGTWSTCKGTLTRTATTFTWTSELDECSIEGATSMEDGLISLHDYSLDTCRDTPWWLELFSEPPATYQPMVIGERLTLVPTIPVPTGRVLHLEENVMVENWSLVSNEGDTNLLKMCWSPDGLFMEGHYRNTNDSTDFISEEGIITEVLPGFDDSINWAARCWGDCPCSAIITVENKTETTIAGRYNGSNCARTFDGTFTGTAAR